MKTYAGVGARKTPHDRRVTMIKIGEALRDRGWLLRSGGAEGADIAFAQGAHPFSVTVLQTRKFVLPHRAFEIAEDLHPAWQKCTDEARALLARTVVVLLGINFDDPVTFVAYWHPLNVTRGGTRFTVRLAQEHDIPTYNIDNIHDDLLAWMQEMDAIA